MNRIDLWVKLMELGHMCGCHQLPERSFSIMRYQLPLCARCTGIVLGQLAALFLPALRRAPVKVGAALLLPMAIDGGTQFLGLQESNNRRRLITGLLGGVGYLALLRGIFLHIRTKKKE